ncbi:hypothetical protein EV702DRAFT_1201626 [Suillus placidus]|uniref:Uncharacterized protein n=1 Tax=Suillus placidus TaxID=48579 RepID=A0A9P6ZMB2_9AGAM|nr:hypothetical protein EV702DRAFT_1201626 [Suillus placidus]
MELRAKESSKPHIAGTVGDLIAGIFNPNEQRCILDCVISTGLPQYLRLSALDDGLMAWHRTLQDCPLKGKFVHPDNFRIFIGQRHPKATKAAVLDVITPDTKHGLMVAGAEFLMLLSNCSNSFPNLAQKYEIHISHSKIADLVLNRIPEELRSSVIEIINQSKSTTPQKRVSLLKKGLLRSTTDELEALAEIGDLRTGIRVHELIAGIDEDINTLLSKLEKVSPTLVTVMKPAVEEIKQTIQFATSAGFSAPVFFHPVMWGAHHMHFKEGVCIEVVRRTRRLDVLAAAGRYDNLIAQYSNPKPRLDPICAFAVQIALEKIAMVLAAF